MRVANFDMTDNSNQCPSTLTQRIDSNKRTLLMEHIKRSNSFSYLNLLD